MWKVSNVIERLPSNAQIKDRQVTKPEYKPTGAESGKVGLFIEELVRHVTDEGHQLQLGLQQQGFKSYGRRLLNNETDVLKILQTENPHTLYIGDKREWDKDHPWGGWRDTTAHFYNTDALSYRNDIFKVTLHKDVHARFEYNRQFAASANIHAWIVYYHPDIVIHLAPFMREENLIRIYHSVDMLDIPDLSKEREGCLLSGAVSKAYPLRKRLIDNRNKLPKTKYLQHPGYAANGSHTKEFLQILSQHKIAICTTSMYGYSLRKIIEAVACGCVCITDLAEDDVLPEIDKALVRVHPDITVEEISGLIRKYDREYNLEERINWAHKAMNYYDFRTSAERLSNDIENMRMSYEQVGSISTNESTERQTTCLEGRRSSD